MKINKTKIKSFLILFTALFTFSLFCSFDYADSAKDKKSVVPTSVKSISTKDVKAPDKTTKEIKDTLDRQNEDLEHKVDFKMDNSSEKYLDKLAKQADSNSGHNIDISNLRKDLPVISMKLFLSARKYAIVFFIILLMFSVLKMTVFGSKNVINRRNYLLGIISLSLGFVVILNIPIILLYFQNTDINKAFSANKFYEWLLALIVFLRSQSFPICGIVLIYGLVQKLLSKADVSKIRLSRYLINMSILLFIALNLLPSIVNVII